MLRYSFLILGIIFGFVFLYKYHVFYLNNSNFVFDSFLKKICFHFYRYFNGLFFFISIFLHFVFFFVTSSLFCYFFTYFWIFKSFWLAFILFYCFFLCLLLPILILSFFTILDLFYYNMFFESYFCKVNTFYYVFKKVHLLNLGVFPFLFFLLASFAFYYLYEFYFIIHLFRLRFFGSIIFFILFFLKSWLSFFDLANIIFSGSSLFIKKD